jgi:ferrochelatase
MNAGVVLTAYGSPDSFADVEPYLRDIRGGRAVSDAALASLVARYERIGLPSPLRDITARQARLLEEELGMPVEIGMKHWTPRIADAVRALAARGVERIVGIAAAPHYSRISIGGYESRLRDAADGIEVSMVPSWHLEPAFVELVASNVVEALRGWAPDGKTEVVFTAHSLPERILAEGDPYRDQLLASSEAVARAAGAPRRRFAFQSASATGEPWLGPDLLDALGEVARAGARRALVVPIGFVSDHLEILYDVDVEARERAASLGLELRRVRSPNDDPRLARAMAAAVRAQLRARDGENPSERIA